MTDQISLWSVIRIFKVPSFQIMAHNNKNLKLTLTVKDKEGKTFTNTDSLKFETKVSDESLLEPMTPYPFIPQVPLSDKLSIDGRRKFP